MVMIDGQIYMDSGEILATLASIEKDGQITSPCDNVPTENNQSNFGSGYNYQYNMPRVAIKKKEYMISDLSQWIVGRMYAMKIKQEEMGEVIGVNQSGFSKRLSKGKFTYAELISILKHLQATDEEILRLMKL